MDQLLKLKPKIQMYEPITLLDGQGNSLVVQALGTDLSGGPASSAVFKVYDDLHRVLILKVGYSGNAKRVAETLCVKLLDQAEREAGILRKMQDCDLVPRVVLTGYWDDKPVWLTELEGTPLLRQQQLPHDAATVEQLCRDLTRTVLILFQNYGVAHADINLSNIGVYHRPDKHKHQGSRFYLYDFGCAVEVKQGHARVPVSLLFSSREVIQNAGTAVGLMSELTAVAYICLYLAAGCTLPWETAAERGDLMSCCAWRELYGMSLDEKTELQSLGPRVRDWITFVLTQPADLGFHPVWSAAHEFLEL